MNRNLLVAVFAAVALIAVGVGGYLIGAHSPSTSTSAPAVESIVPPQPPPLPDDLRFIDHFETLDRDLYYFSNRGRDGPHTESDLRESQISLTPEGAVIEMAAGVEGSDAPLSSAEFYTQERYFRGYFEVRMRVPRGAGVITGFFTYIGPWDGVRPSQELDMEILGRNTRLLYLAHHIGGASREKIVRLPFDAAESFHNYAFEWTEDAFRWYVDGRMVHEVTGAPVQRMDEAQRLTINLWATRQLAGWAGAVDPQQGPWRLTVACLASAETNPGRPLCQPR
jgi:endo-1,3-1,4-beta-glycanase ExoK